MKKNILFALSALFCVCAFSFVLTSCGDDEPDTPTTMTQDFYVKGELTSQGGSYIDGETDPNDSNTKEFKFYKEIYDDVIIIIKAQKWTISFKPDEKKQKISEQNEIAKERYTAMANALDAIQMKLDQTDKDEYKCHFRMTITMEAAGEDVICSGQKTLIYEGNEK